MIVDARIFCGMALVFLVLLQVSCGSQPAGKSPSGKHVVLLGASVGKEWRLTELPQRVPAPGYSFESVTVYQFDKTEGLEEILIRPRRKFRLTRTYLKGFFEEAPKRPDIVIVKECAAYFPGDLQTYQNLMKAWIRRIRDAGLVPAVATVAPVTRARDAGNPGQLAAIRRFNDWLREYARLERLPLVDLEEVLKESGADGFLREDFTGGDGLHLNQQAYRRLDGELLRALGLGPERNPGAS